METQIFEINGTKVEVDLRTATRIDTFTIGTKVKLLKKSDYSEPEVYSGVIVGFEPFESLPTLIVCYLENGYLSTDLKFAHINSNSADKYEMVQSIDDTMPVDRADVLDKLSAEVEKKRAEIEEIEKKRDYFLRHFDQWFEAPTHET